MKQTMIHKIYLLPQAQGKGIGTRLIDFISEIGKAMQETHVRLKVFVRNPKALGFYEKIGFSNTGIENTDIGNNYVISDYVMLRKI
jgi:diamine N-acetyltransferase